MPERSTNHLLGNGPPRPPPAATATDPDEFTLCALVPGPTGFNVACVARKGTTTTYRCTSAP